MNLDNIINQTIEKRLAVAQKYDLEALRERLFKIKKTSIQNLTELRQKAVANLVRNGFTVFEAKDNEAAIQHVVQLVGQEKLIVKAKSNMLKELEINELATKKGWMMYETDTGDFIASLFHFHSDHPISPAMSFSKKEIAQKINEQYQTKLSDDPHEIVDWIRNFLREKFFRARIGICGANAISAEGQIILVENEGNLSLVTRLPQKTIIVAGIEKIVPHVEDGLQVINCASLFSSTAGKWAGYVSVIGSPSKTADIEREVIFGAQGAREVHVILVDDWRSEFAKTEFAPMLYCINCGACLDLCPVFLTSMEAVKVLDEKKNANCATCKYCTQICPAKIDWYKLTKMAREKFQSEGKAPPKTYEMLKNIREHGNPFGKVTGEIKELYCC